MVNPADSGVQSVLNALWRQGPILDPGSIKVSGRIVANTNRGSHDPSREEARGLMRRLRLLIAAIVLGVAAGPASAEDFWGRKIVDPPTNFISGYGSLINTASRNSTATKPIAAIPARLGTGFGYVRCWRDRSSSGFTALGLRRPQPGESAMTINGVLYPVEGDDMAAFDRRETGYARVEAPRDQIEAVSWHRLPEDGKIWVYVPVTQGREPGVDLPTPSSAFPMLESYIDVVLEGGMEYGLRARDHRDHDRLERLLAERPRAAPPPVGVRQAVLGDRQDARGHGAAFRRPHVSGGVCGKEDRPQIAASGLQGPGASCWRSGRPISRSHGGQA